MGEFLVEWFAVEIRAEVNEGKEWQKELDAEERKRGIVPAQCVLCMLIVQHLIIPNSHNVDPI